MSKQTENKTKITVALDTELVREINQQRAEALARKNTSISFSKALNALAWKGADKKAPAHKKAKKSKKQEVN